MSAQLVVGQRQKRVLHRPNEVCVENCQSLLKDVESGGTGEDLLFQDIVEHAMLRKNKPRFVLDFALISHHKLDVYSRPRFSQCL